MSPAPTFELLRFESTPVAPAVAVVELAGSFSGLEPVRPRLLVESGGVSREMPALEAGGSPWSATFAVPLDALGDPGATFSLVPGRGPLIALPAPTDAGGDDDRFVRLARAVNELRHRLTAAEEAAAQRDALAAELAEVRDQLAAAEARAAEAHEAAIGAREEQARAEGEADLAREALARAREEARAEVREEIEGARAEAEQARAQLTEAQDRAIAAEDDARAARRDLRDARARIEALARQSRTARTAAARARVHTATPHGTFGDDPAFHAARLGPDWAEGAPEDAPLAEEEGAEDATAPVPADDAADDATAPLPSDDATTPLAADEPHHPAAPLPADDDTDDAAAPLRADDPHHPAAPLPVDDATDDDAAPLPADDATAPLPADDAVDDATAPLPAHDAPERAAPDDDERADRAARLGDTAPLEPVRAAGEPATTAHLAPVDPADEPASPRRGLWRDEEPAKSVRVLRPRTKAGRLAPLPARAPEDDDDQEAPDEDVLPPAAVGARLIQPAEMSLRRRAVAILTNPRVIVGGIFVLLITALVLIFMGFGPF